ncbi:hypothetical protein GW915_06075 [bacterium]|nr:hypothetical protein [bacterium]
MSLSTLLSQVLKNPPQVAIDHEIEVLHELPVQTLYFALKEADSDMALWLTENSRVTQLQGLIDLDCWSGDQFEPARFMNFFHLLARCSPQRLRYLSKELDPEVIVRSLMEYCTVVDFDPQEPPQVPESQLMISPDGKYALILKEEDLNIRESLMIWLDKISATDLDLMRRHLESCKWEQISDIEEFAYGIKKGRLEDHGFVDRSEAIGIYASGHASKLKAQLLANPLPPKAKAEASEATPSIDGSFIPEIIRGPLSESNFFATALAEIDEPKIKEVLILESLRAVNIAIMADDLIHESVDCIKEAASRTRKYLDLGLFYLCDGKIELGKRELIEQPLFEVVRLGWLLTKDLVTAADVLRSKYPSQTWGLSDGFLIQKLSGRHPELFESELKAIGSSNKEFISLESITKCAERLATLGAIQNFVQDSLSEVLHLETDPLASTESLYSRLLTGIVRQDIGGAFSVSPINPKEWELIQKGFQRERLNKLVETFCNKAPKNTQVHLEVRMHDCLDELEKYLKSRPSMPLANMFSALRIDKIKPQTKGSTNGQGANA